VTARRPPAKRQTKRRASGKSALLEQCVESLHLLDFQIYQSNGSFQRAKVVPVKYVIRNVPHLSLYGTPGRKEALVVAPDGRDLFMPDERGCARIIIEAKWQDVNGSVDEKLPYVWEAFQNSPVQNWVIVLDGRFWKTGRGKAAANWLASKAGQMPMVQVFLPAGDEDEEPVLLESPLQLGRTLRVVDRKGFIDLAMQAWGQP